MNTHPFAAMLLAVAMAGCGHHQPEPSSAPASAAPESIAQQSAGDDAAAADTSEADVRLNDEFVSPDSMAEAVSDDEPDASDELQDFGEPLDPLADVESPTAVEVKFIPSATTNILIAGEQQAYALAIDKRNQRLRSRRETTQQAGSAAETDQSVQAQ